MATSAQSANIFARLGLKPKSPFAAVSESSIDEPGDPQPGAEDHTIPSHSPFAGVAPSAPHEEGDPYPAAGTPQHTTTLPTRGTPGGNVGHNTGSNGGTLS